MPQDRRSGRVHTWDTPSFGLRGDLRPAGSRFAGLERARAAHVLTSVEVLGAALVRRIEGPFSSRRCELWSRRSQMEESIRNCGV
jgi:hypothetical protein